MYSVVPIGAGSSLLACHSSICCADNLIIIFPCVPDNCSIIIIIILFIIMIVTIIHNIVIVIIAMSWLCPLALVPLIEGLFHLLWEQSEDFIPQQ